MNIQIVEPTKCIGYSSKVTNTTLGIASQLSFNDFDAFNDYKELWIDNGAFESGVANEVSKYMNVIDRQILIANSHQQHVKHAKTFFALPDIACDYRGTINLYNKYIFHIKNNLDEDIELVGIPQGKTLEEYTKSIEFFIENNVRYFGFSCLDRRWMYDKFPVVDDDMFDWFQDMVNVSYNNIHVLGFELEDLQYPAFYKCNSFDTSYPIKLLMLNKQLGEDGRRPKDYFKREVEKHEVIWAVKQFKKWIDTNKREIA